MTTPSETRISIPRSQTITHEVTKTRNSQPEIEESRKVGGKYSIEGLFWLRPRYNYWALVLSGQIKRHWLYLIPFCFLNAFE